MSIAVLVFGTCPVWRYSIGLLFQLEFWKDRASKAVLNVLCLFHPFSNKVKIVHLRAGCFLKLDRDSRWKLSFIFIITESNEPVKSIGISFFRYT
jgi:hypothetical protein